MLNISTNKTTLVFSGHLTMILYFIKVKVARSNRYCICESVRCRPQSEPCVATSERWWGVAGAGMAAGVFRPGWFPLDTAHQGSYTATTQHPAKLSWPPRGQSFVWLSHRHHSVKHATEA